MNTLTQLKLESPADIRSFKTSFANRAFPLMTELELVLACQQLRPGAIEELLARHKGSIRNIVYRLSPDCLESADICQEAQIKVWRSIPSLRRPERFRAWLKRIVTNLYYDDLRKIPKGIYLVSTDEPILGQEDSSDTSTRSICDPAPQPEAIVLGRELMQEMARAISVIPREFGIAMLLRDEDGLSYEEIAMLTNSELGTVKSRISRGRGKVKQNMAAYLAANACVL